MRDIILINSKGWFLLGRQSVLQDCLDIAKGVGWTPKGATLNEWD